MTKWILRLTLLLIPTLLFAQTAVQKDAAQAYEKGDFTKAAELYQSLADEDYQSADLYLNLGNAYYKSGEVAKAILNYERGLLIAPGDADLKTNLEIAHLKTVDRIEPVGEIFLSRWMDSVRNLYSSNQWAVIAIVSFILLLGCFALYFIGGKVWMKKVAFFSALLLIVLTIFANVASAEQKVRFVERNSAIIFAKSVTAKSTPSESGTDLFVLHEGTKVKVRTKVGNWNEVELSDGNVGWIPTDKLEII